MFKPTPRKGTLLHGDFVLLLTPTPFLFSLPVDIVRLPGKVPLLPARQGSIVKLFTDDCVQAWLCDMAMFICN